MSENKSSTKNAEKGTDELANALFMDKKPSTFDVDKGTDELAFMKQKVNTIHRKGLNQFEGQSTGYKGWFKLDIEFLKTTFIKVIQNSIKHRLKIILRIKTWKCIKHFLYRLIKNQSRENTKKTKHDFSIRSTTSRRNSSVQIPKRYRFCYIFFVFINMK